MRTGMEQMLEFEKMKDEKERKVYTYEKAASR